jgi:hypothetical protein
MTTHEFYHFWNLWEGNTALVPLQDKLNKIGMICLSKPGLTEDLFMYIVKEKNFQYYATRAICTLEKCKAYS